MEDIRTGRADGWKDYYRRYDHYLGNQQRLFGENWQTPTDVIAEARHYGLITDQTLGRHTELLQKNEKPLDALRTRLTTEESVP